MKTSLLLTLLIVFARATPADAGENTVENTGESTVEVPPPLFSCEVSQITQRADGRNKREGNVTFYTVALVPNEVRSDYTELMQFTIAADGEIKGRLRNGGYDDINQFEAQGNLRASFLRSSATGRLSGGITCKRVALEFVFYTSSTPPKIGLTLSPYESPLCFYGYADAAKAVLSQRIQDDEDGSRIIKYELAPDGDLLSYLHYRECIEKRGYAPGEYECITYSDTWHVADSVVIPSCAEFKHVRNEIKLEFK